jgi:hypothetical protein
LAVALQPGIGSECSDNAQRANNQQSDDDNDHQLGIHHHRTLLWITILKGALERHTNEEKTAIRFSITLDKVNQKKFHTVAMKLSG